MEMPTRAKISTKELFDRFFENKDEENARKTRPQIDRPEVYEYEKKIGKQLVEMDVDELFEMILTFNGNRSMNSSTFSVSYSSYDQIASMYRSLFNYYIDNVEVIKNPFNDKRMRGTQAAQRLAKSKEPFNIELVDKMIENLHNDFEPEHAMYYECIIRMFYEGFAKAEEIVMLDEDMISKKDKTVRLPGRTIQLSDRCFELLEHIHQMEDIEGWRGDFAMVSWRGHYFKYIVRPRKADELQAREMSDIANVINRAIIVNVKNKYGVDINYRLLYLLGFYESLKKTFGKERTRELIVSVRNSKDTADLMGAARLYGVVVDNVTHLKKFLRPFIGE
jgi:integrase